MSDRTQCPSPKRRWRNDLILTLAIVSLAIAVGLCFYFFRDRGTEVQVTVNGETFGCYSLEEDRTVEICTEKGRNLLIIRNGEAYVEYADCPDGICEDHKPIFRVGESIVCLPHGVVITVRGVSGDGTPDLIV